MTWLSRAAQRRQDRLTKPQGSLGRLEEIVAWLARWQGRAMPQLDKVAVMVFAGSHGVTAQGVSAFPAEVTAQMVANFAAGGAAINQLARAAGAASRWSRWRSSVRPPISRKHAAMSEAEFLAAVATGYDAVEKGTDLICFGEMGIGNTTPPRRSSAALFRRAGRSWVGRGTGVDDAGLARKAAAVDAGPDQRIVTMLDDPLKIAAALGGRELAAILGATLAARHNGVPVLLDGFVCTAAVAPLAKAQPGRARRTCLPRMSRPKRRIAGCSSDSACRRCSISTCGSAKAPAPAWPSTSFARRWNATPAWRALRRRASRRNDGLRYVQGSALS